METKIRLEFTRKVRLALVGFVPQSGNEFLAKTILDVIGVEGSSVQFCTGGDTSEPEGAMIEIPGYKGLVDIFEVSGLVDWKKVEFRGYQRWGDYTDFGATKKFKLDDGLVRAAASQEVAILKKKIMERQRSRNIDAIERRRRNYRDFSRRKVG